MTDFAPTDYSHLNQRVKKERKGVYPNFGNKVWLQGLVSEITTDGISYDLAYESIMPEIIHTMYDAVILPMANIFHKGWITWLNKRAEYIRQIKVPVYVIACGVQITNYQEIDQLIKDVGLPARNFIESVYSSGGEFGLRGEITGEFFSRLGYHSAVVTGCPSMFQMGSSFSISNDKVSRKDFSASINGDINRLGINSRSIKNADFIDQGSFGHLLYDPNYGYDHPIDNEHLKKMIRKYGMPFVNNIIEDKIKLFVDLQQWMSYFVQNHISFSYGSRIHGTIMPILAGVPSMLCACDMRTEEMARYFDIPMIHPNCRKRRDIYDLYMEADYTRFNENYQKRYKKFEGFFVSHGLASKLNEVNIFLNRSLKVNLPVSVNSNYRKALKEYIDKRKLYWLLYQNYRDIKAKRR